MKGKKINSGQIKLKILANGILIDDTATQIHDGEFIEKKYRFGKSDDELAPSSVPYEIELPEDVIVGVHHNAKSPWRILSANKDLELYYLDKFVCRVCFVPKPRFWGTRLPSGSWSDEVGVLYAKYAFTFFSNEYCHYWESGVPCQFCSLKPTRKHSAKVLSTISPNVARDTVRLALENDGDKINCIKFTSGTYKDRDHGILEAIDIWKEILSVSNRKILHHFVAMPPKKLSLLRDLKLIGVNTISMALEVTDPDLFSRLCPGKANDIGYDGYLEALEYAVQTFGVGKVYCALVGGLEPLDNMYRNLESLAKKGIVPSVNIFHPDEGSLMSSHPRPSESYLREMVIRENDLFRRYGYEPCVRGNTRNALDNECVRGFFDNI